MFRCDFSGVGAIFGSECGKRGMLVRVAGDNIMMSPPLVITPDEIDEVRFPMLILHTLKKKKMRHFCFLSALSW